MNGRTIQASPLGPMVQVVPAPVDSAERIVNMRVDPDTAGWSSRVGYERYRPNPASGFSPFQSLGRIDSVYVFEQVGGGARYHVLLESGGTLYLLNEAGLVSLRALVTGRSVPTPSEPASVYARVGQSVLVTNGQDWPLLVQPWPLRDSVVWNPGDETLARPLGWAAAPRAPRPLGVQPTGATSSSADTSGDEVSVWWPSKPRAIEWGGQWGLGLTGAAGAPKASEYRYAVSFIADTGAESPLSALSSPVTWDNVGTFRWAVAVDLPTGPAGTVARRLYRTRNTSNDASTAGDETLYRVADIAENVTGLYWDAVRDTAMGDQAPSRAESVPLPAPGARVGAVWGDCTWLDGGANDGTRLYFSHPGLPDQFGAADYLNLGSDGGAVVGLFAYYTLLVVLRESGVDVVTGQYPTFQVSTVSQQVACRSPHAVDAVPGLGIVMLAQDGVYRLDGGLDGGAVFRLERISDTIRDELQRLTQDCAQRAVARYSPATREFHLYLPVDGNDRPNLGLVYHLDRSGWSVREGFPVGAIDRMYDGSLVFGHHTGAEAGNTAEAGLFIVSGVRSMGGTVTEQQFTPGPPPVSVWRSPWLNMGDAQLEKQPQYVTLHVLTTGDITVALRWRKDWAYAWTTARPFKLQPPDRAELDTFDEATLPATWERARVVPLRIPVAAQSCAWWQFEVQTTEDVVVVGWQVEYQTRGTRVIEGRR